MEFKEVLTQYQQSVANYVKCKESLIAFILTALQSTFMCFYAAQATGHWYLIVICLISWIGLMLMILSLVYDIQSPNLSAETEEVMVKSLILAKKDNESNTAFMKGVSKVGLWTNIVLPFVGIIVYWVFFS